MHDKLKLPLEYRWLKAHNFDGLTPWHIVEPDKLKGIREEYRLETGNDILPFARRQDNDCIAGFEILNGTPTSKVLTIHLTWSRKKELNGYPITEVNRNLFEWIKNIVIPATEDWMSEEELEDIIENR